MHIDLQLGPAGSGKTQVAIDRIQTVAAAEPLSPVWAIVADRNQGASFQHRLAARGTAGVRVGTFGDLYAEILGQAGRPFPITPESLIHRLIRRAIDEGVDSGEVTYYVPIRHRPGLVTLLAELFAELKRSRITPELLQDATKARGPRLEEVALLYGKYQSLLRDLEWSDHEGLGWLAVEALEADEEAFSDLRLLVVDGFESFNPTQVALLKELAPRTRQSLITLTGDPAMSRLAFRSFRRTLVALQENLPLRIQELIPGVNRMPAIAHLEANLFGTDARQVAAGKSISFLEAQNVALEAREALRWIKARMVRDGVRADECAVIAPDIGLYRVFLAEAGREFGLPLRLACGEPLRANPAIAAVLNLLELPIRNWQRRPLLDVLRSPYFDLSPFGLSSVDAVAFDRLAHSGQVIEGLDQWREAIRLAANESPGSEAELEPDDEVTARRPVGMAARRYGERLEGLIARLTPPAEGSLTKFAGWVEELLAERTGLSLGARLALEEDTAPRDKVAVEAFAAALGSLVLSDSLLSRSASATYEQFLAELRGTVDTSIYRVDDRRQRSGGCVYAANISAVRGMSYRAVAILGLSEGVLPSPIQEDPLLPDEERAALREQGLLLEPRLRSDQQTLFYEGVTRATDFLLLTRPYLADDGEAWEASPYWAAALKLFETRVQRVRHEDVRSHLEAASPVELLMWCVRRRALPGSYGELGEAWQSLRYRAGLLRAKLQPEGEGEYEGSVRVLGSRLEERFGRQHVWSATRLEHYGACPFQFFVSEALGLQERKPIVAGFDPAQLGSMLHEILEGAYRECADPMSVESVLAVVPEIADAVFAAGPKKYGFRATALWVAERDELFDSIKSTVRGLGGRQGGFRPCYFELAFGYGGDEPLIIETADGPVRLRGRIDRIDVDDGGNLQVIDYKTGATDLHSNDFRDGRRLQLAIYALAAEESLTLGRVVEGFYWAIRKAEISNLNLASFRAELDEGVFSGARGAMELVKGHVGTIVQAIRTGAFAPAPERGCKSYCPARLFCWRFQPARF